MTNLQKDVPRISSRMLRRLWSWGPLAILGLLALAVLVVAVIPRWLMFQRDSRRLADLDSVRQQISLMRGQLSQALEDQQTARSRKAQLLQLITGSGEITTFMAMLDREAVSAGVQLELFEPQPDLAPVPEPGNVNGVEGDQDQQPTESTDPLEVDGLRRQPILVVAKGRFVDLLSFQRRLENLQVLVVQNNLELVLDGDDPSKLVMKQALSLYAKSEVPEVGAGSEPEVVDGLPPP